MRHWHRSRIRETAGRDLERHLAAVWFADIVGYTRLSAENEPSAWRLVEMFQDLVRQVVKLYGGRVVKFTGDGALAEFPSTELAVRSGHVLVGKFASAALDRGLGERVLRIGVHVGDVGRTADGDLIGDGVNVAARIQAEADPAQVWVSEDVRRQLRQHPDLHFESRGERQVKGIAQPLSLHAVAVTDETDWVRPRRPRAIGRRLMIGAGILALTLAVVVSAYFLTRKVSEVASENADRVAVIPFENRTGDPSLDSVGQIAADWIGEFIVRSGFVEVVDFHAAMGIPAAPDENGAVLASQAGAGTLVMGSFYRQADDLVFQARILRSDGTLITVLPSVSGEDSDPIEVIDRLRERVVTALAAHFDRRIPAFEGMSAEPPSLAAYEKYVSGLRWYLLGEYASAGDEFQQAIEIDSTFARARVWLLAARGFTELESVDSLAAEIERRESALSKYDLHHARFFTSFLMEDYEQAYVEARAMLEASPGSRDALRETALSAIRIGRPDEGIRLLRQLSHDRILLDNWPQYSLHLAQAHLQVGDPESALSVAREGRRNHPDSPDPVTAEALALIDLDRVREAVQILDPLFLASPENPWIAASLLAVALRASGRGHESVADSLLERSLEWMVRGRDPWSEDAYLRTLLAADNLPEAQAVVELELAAGNRNARLLGTYGIIAARVGDVEEANIALRDLDARHDNRNRIWRARILAVLGKEAEAARLLGGIEVDPWLVEMPVVLWPEFAPLRGRPGFPPLPERVDSP